SGNAANTAQQVTPVIANPAGNNVAALAKPAALEASPAALINTLKQALNQLAHPQVSGNDQPIADTPAPVAPTGQNFSSGQNSVANSALITFDAANSNTAGQDSGNADSNAGTHDFLALTPIASPQVAPANGLQNAPSFSQTMNDVQSVTQTSSPAEQ